MNTHAIAVPSTSRDNNNREAFLDPHQAAAFLNLDPRTLLRWAREGIVPAHPLSGNKRRTWRFLAFGAGGLGRESGKLSQRVVSEFKELMNADTLSVRLFTEKMKRKDGIERWQFRWQQRSPDGRLRERKITFGSVKDFPGKE